MGCSRRLRLLLVGPLSKRPFLIGIIFQENRLGGFAVLLARVNAWESSMTLPSHDKKPVQFVATEAFEKHYSVLEIAKMWSLSERTIRRMFDGEEGVLHWKNGEGTGRRSYRAKRGYQTLRIPESVMMRVYQRIRAAS